ncbi:MAG: pyrroline-5-carboxylate reductase [Candidatus Goldiibacteriota bacterium]
MEKKVIGFIGTGNMARAVLKGVYDSELREKYYLYGYDKSVRAVNYCRKNFKMIKAKNAGDIVEESDIIFLAVKPGDFKGAAEGLKKIKKNSLLAVSVMAGISVKSIKESLPSGTGVIRVMPNTPAFLGEGACGYAAGKGVSAVKEKEAVRILETFSRVCEKFSEEMLDAVTAVSGSGPAYFFYFAEAMMKAAADMKMRPAAAKKLIAQTMYGSAKMIMQTGEPIEKLRMKVTSKGGTTQSAVDVMKKNNVDKIIRRAVRAAEKRAKELGN